jgi:hypothetical protein
MHLSYNDFNITLSFEKNFLSWLSFCNLFEWSIKRNLGRDNKTFSKHHEHQIRQVIALRYSFPAVKDIKMLDSTNTAKISFAVSSRKFFVNLSASRLNGPFSLCYVCVMELSIYVKMMNLVLLLCGDSYHYVLGWWLMCYHYVFKWRLLCYNYVFGWWLHVVFSLCLRMTVVLSLWLGMVTDVLCLGMVTDGFSLCLGWWLLMCYQLCLHRASAVLSLHGHCCVIIM